MSGAIKIEDLASTIAEELGNYGRNVTDASGWTSKVAFESDEDIRVTVYNRKKPQLTHLLEHGHAKASGGRIEGKPHIGPAEQAAEKKLLKKVKVVVKGDS